MIFDERLNRGKCSHCGETIYVCFMGYFTHDRTDKNTWYKTVSDRKTCGNGKTIATPITKNDIVTQILNDL